MQFINHGANYVCCKYLGSVLVKIDYTQLTIQLKKPYNNASDY